MCKIPLFILTLLFLALNSGNALEQSYVLGDRATQGFTSLSAFSSRHNLRLLTPPGGGRLEFRGEGVRLTLAPGLKYCQLNGQMRRLTQSPVARGGELLIPNQITTLLPVSAVHKPSAGPVSGTVILDPGHGGKDPGGVSNGVQEKDVVLDVALRTARILRRNGVTVVMTRSDDRFIPLGGRSAIANQHNDVAFISIHANIAKEASARGIETFVLSGNVTENYRVNKAAKEFDLRDHRTAGAPRLGASQERSEIARMSAKARHRSKQLAAIIQKQLISRTRDTDRRVKQKNLHVLREAFFCPAVLTEIGFMSNRLTATRLKTPEYRARIASALADGIMGYLRTVK